MMQFPLGPRKTCPSGATRAGPVIKVWPYFTAIWYVEYDSFHITPHADLIRCNRGHDISYRDGLDSIDLLHGKRQANATYHHCVHAGPSGGEYRWCPADGATVWAASLSPSQ